MASSHVSLADIPVCVLDYETDEPPTVPNHAEFSNDEDQDAEAFEVVAPLCGVEGVAGRGRGIQGHHNSCYLDATLFAMFTFTSAFDSLLYRPPRPDDPPLAREVQQVLRDEIVHELRRQRFVCAARVMRLRTLLAKATDVPGLTTDEKDPEELLAGLFTQVLRPEPYLKLSTGHHAHTYQVFVERTSGGQGEEEPPTVQQLIEQSMLESGVRLLEAPSVLVVQLPRWGPRYRLYGRVLPSPILDVSILLQDQMHVPQFMHLFAVLCIDTSHYVALVKGGEHVEAGWCLFDSMADRQGDRDGYNIPEVTVIPEMATWLSEEGARKLCAETSSDRLLPPLAKRLLCDAYMCFYRDPLISMYR